MFITNNLSITGLPIRMLEIIESPSRQAPWFIFELFFIQVVYFVCCAFSNMQNSKYLLWTLFALSVPIISGAEYFISKNTGGGYQWVHHIYLLLFFLGHIMQIVEWNKKMVGPVTFFAFMVFCAVTVAFDFSSPSFKMTCIKAVCSLTFSVSAYLVIKEAYPSISSLAKKYFNLLGTHTLEIYLTHFSIISIFCAPWIEVGDMRSIPLFILLVIIALPVCYIVIKIAEVLKYVPWASTILYGKHRS